MALGTGSGMAWPLGCCCGETYAILLTQNVHLLFGPVDLTVGPGASKSLCALGSSRTGIQERILRFMALSLCHFLSIFWLKTQLSLLLFVSSLLCLPRLPFSLLFYSLPFPSLSLPALSLLYYYFFALC